MVARRDTTNTIDTRIVGRMWIEKKNTTGNANRMTREKAISDGTAKTIGQMKTNGSRRN